jgi:hypothetical protein
MQHATGTFEVKVTPEAQSNAPPGGRPVARMALSKTFHGGLNGSAEGIMLSVGVPAPGQAAAYVAVDQFHGTVDGRTGGFLLLHHATMSPDGTAAMSVTIAADSGTGELVGIEGALAIEIEGSQHRYDLAYTLP